MYLALARTRSSRFGVECANHEITVLPHGGVIGFYLIPPPPPLFLPVLHCTALLDANASDALWKRGLPCKTDSFGVLVGNLK